MNCHILTENGARRRGFLAEHGLSILIEHPEGTILFDTGQSDVYCHNAALMGLDLTKVDSVVLSHGHYDHCGGLIHFPKTYRFPQIYVRRDAFATRYALNPDGRTYRDIGIPWSPDQQVRIQQHIVYTQPQTRLTPHIMLCSEVPFTNEFEGTPRGFYTDDGSGKTADHMQDEQMLVVEREQGLSVFLGCSHPGVVNCLAYVQRQFPGKKIESLVAGMHLNGVSPERLQRTIQALREWDIPKIIPLHCTGMLAISEMKRAFGSRCTVVCSGDSFEL